MPGVVAASRPVFFPCNACGLPVQPADPGPVRADDAGHFRRRGYVCACGFAWVTVERIEYIVQRYGRLT